MQVEQISVTESSADGAVRMTVGSQVRNEQDEPAVVLAAREILAGWRHPDDFDAVFDEATVYARRPSHPGVLVTDIPGCGRWAAVFSTAQRLAHQFGDGPFFVTTGADLLAQLPPGVVGMLDPGDAHRFPVLRRVVPPTVLAAMRRKLLREQRAAALQPVTRSPTSCRDV